MSAAPERACVVGSGLHGKTEGTVAEVLDTSLNVLVEAEREAGQSRDPEVGSLKWACVLVDN